MHFLQKAQTLKKKGPTREGKKMTSKDAEAKIRRKRKMQQMIKGSSTQAAKKTIIVRKIKEKIEEQHHKKMRGVGKLKRA